MINAVRSVWMLCMNGMFILRLFWPILYCYFLFLIILFPLFLFLLFLNICHSCIIFIIPVFILSFCNSVFLSIPFWFFLQYFYSHCSKISLILSIRLQLILLFHLRMDYFCNREFLLSLDCLLQNEWHHCCLVTDDVTHCAKLSSALKAIPLYLWTFDFIF